MPVLISFSGLPGVGKTTIARALAEDIGAVYLRVDSVDAALKRSVLKSYPAEDAGYQAICAVAADNLKLGRDVITDTVNPIPVSRDFFKDTAKKAGARLLNVEIVCSDAAEHRRRVEARRSDLDGLDVPTWDKVLKRDYRPWMEPRLVLDSANLPTKALVSEIKAALENRSQ